MEWKKVLKICLFLMILPVVLGLKQVMIVENYGNSASDSDEINNMQIHIENSPYDSVIWNTSEYPDDYQFVTIANSKMIIMGENIE